MKHLILLHDPLYGSERSFNGLRLVRVLVEHNLEAEIIVFLMADAVPCAKAGQKAPDGYYNLEPMIRRVLTVKRHFLMCGTCMDARGLTKSILGTNPRSIIGWHVQPLCEHVKRLSTNLGVSMPCLSFGRCGC